MGKGLQIVLLAVLFAGCAAGGWFLQGAVMGDGDVQEEPEVKTVIEVKPTVPEADCIPVISEVTAPKREADGRFSFSVTSSVASGDDLLYVLYGDKDCTVEVAKELQGNFNGIAPTASQTYWLKVQNMASGDWSTVTEVKGFVQLVMYEKITAAELEQICNSGDYGTASPNFSKRISSKFSIISRGMKPEENPVSTVGDICSKVAMGIWRSVSVENITYDSQNRMKELTLRVNY